jgi:hypothetical protein
VIDIGRFHHKSLLLIRRRVAAGKVLQHAAELARAQFAVFSEVVLLNDLFELILLLNLRPELLLPFRLLAPPICNLSPPPSPPSTWSAHTLLLSTLSGEAKSVKATISRCTGRGGPAKDARQHTAHRRWPRATSILGA